MPQPPEPELRQWSHNLPADFASSAISRTLQQKLHSPQAFPGIASMNFSLVIDSDSIVHLFIAEGASAREIETHLKDFCSGAPFGSTSHHASPSSLSTKAAIPSLARAVRRCSAERIARRPANVLCRSSFMST